MKVVADTHEAPPLRRWLVRLGLAVVVAIIIGYVPGQLLRRDPRADRLSQQLVQLRDEARALAAGNAALYKEVKALRSDVGAIEDRARADLGMVYPGEIVLRVRHADATADVPAAPVIPARGASTPTSAPSGGTAPTASTPLVAPAAHVIAAPTGVTP